MASSSSSPTITTPLFLSPFGYYAAAVDLHGSGLVWDAASGNPLFTLGGVSEAFFSPDERKLAVKRTDGKIWILDAATGLVLYRIPDAPVVSPFAWLEPAYPAVVWSPDSRFVAHVYDGTVAVWDVGD